MLLIDEIDRADDGFEAFLLEVLSDFQVTIPELGTLKAEHIPYVVLTSNRTREIGDALRRRCLYLYIEHPSFEKEVRILRSRVPGASATLAEEIGRFMAALRRRRLEQGARRGGDDRLGAGAAAICTASTSTARPSPRPWAASSRIGTTCAPWARMRLEAAAGRSGGSAGGGAGVEP